jgi:thioredoxin reductase (NADPH)
VWLSRPWRQYIVVLMLVVAWLAVGFGRLGAETTAEATSVVKEQISSADVVVYAADYCPFCSRTIAALSSARVPHVIYDVTVSARAALKRLTGQRTIPYVFVKGEFIGGCNDGPEPWMGTLPLLRSGELQRRLHTSPPAAAPTAESAATSVVASPPAAAPTAERAAASVVVIGSGVAALTAALYLGRAGHAPLVLRGETAGGALSLTPRVDNFPGAADGLSGPQIVRRIEEQAVHAGATMVPASAASLSLDGRPFVVSMTDGAHTSARALVLATGAQPRWLGLEHESSLRGSYLHTCVHCDAPLYAGLRTLVVGGGDGALDAALHLARLAQHVTLVHRRLSFRGAAWRLARVRNASNVHVHAPARVVRWLVSSGKLVGAELGAGPADEQRNLTIECDGAFMAIGRDPATSFLRGADAAPAVALDASGHVQLPEAGRSTRTSIDGVFAAGDVADTRYRQAVTAAGAGAQAAMDADEWLQEHP